MVGVSEAIGVGAAGHSRKSFTIPFSLVLAEVPLRGPHPRGCRRQFVRRVPWTSVCARAAAFVAISVGEIQMLLRSN
eukprot:scaffold29819_cov31-Tisochrysis_lutea.AAC.3